MTATDSVEAFVLHARPWRESSQLVELLTREQGRIGVIARGSRGGRRPNPLQPFQAYHLVLGGRGELRRIQQVEPLAAPVLLSGRVLYAALYVNELLMRLLWRDMPVPGIHVLYAEVIARLAAEDVLEAVLRNFEKRLLDELGYGHRYGYTVEGEMVLAGARYTFDPHAGVREAPPGAAASALYAGEALLALDSGRFRGEVALADAKRLMRLALAEHLGDRPLKSRTLFRPTPLPAAEQSPPETPSTGE